MKNPLVAMGLIGDKQGAPLLLQTDIKYTRSVIHASVQASARAINEALGIDNDAALDEFLQTDAGKSWQRGFRDYAIHCLAKQL